MSDGNPSSGRLSSRNFDVDAVIARFGGAIDRADVEQFGVRKFQNLCSRRGAEVAVKRVVERQAGRPPPRGRGIWKSRSIGTNWSGSSHGGDNDCGGKSTGSDLSFDAEELDVWMSGDAVECVLGGF